MTLVTKCIWSPPSTSNQKKVLYFLAGEWRYRTPLFSLKAFPLGISKGFNLDFIRRTAQNYTYNAFHYIKLLCLFYKVPSTSLIPLNSIIIVFLAVFYFILYIFNSLPILVLRMTVTVIALYGYIQMLFRSSK